ncbi:MAG: phosphoribosyltransferase family protein [Pseudomonadota bacterium]
MLDPSQPRRFITAQEHLEASFALGRTIYDSGFRPSFIVGLWRGGSTVGIAVQECFEYLGVATDHIAIRTSGGPRTHDNDRPIRVHGTQYLLETLNREDRLLLVDDVFSTGRSVTAAVARLNARLRNNMPAEVRTAAVWYRDGEAQDDRRPDFFYQQTRDWLVLPYELSSVPQSELIAERQELEPLFKRVTATRQSS